MRHAMSTMRHLLSRIILYKVRRVHRGYRQGSLGTPVYLTVHHVLRLNSKEMIGEQSAECPPTDHSSTYVGDRPAILPPVSRLHARRSPLAPLSPTREWPATGGGKAWTSCAHRRG